MAETNNMSSQNAWALLRQGDLEQGLALMREAYIRDPTTSQIMRLGVGYLWAEDYQAAWKHFQDAIQKYPLSISAFYGMAGAAKWCLDQPDAAVAHWHEGLDARHADGGIGIHLPLLLLVASILRPSIFPRSEAQQILSIRINDPRANYWPGPLAKFVLGLIDERTLSQMCIGKSERETLHQKWLARFYESLLEFDGGRMHVTELKTAMRRAADTSQPEWAEERNFLRLLWSEEFFIARREASSA